MAQAVPRAGRDGSFVPSDPLAAIAGGSAAGVSLMAGTTSQEWRLFAMMAPGPADADALRERLALLVSDPDVALAAYRGEYGDDAPLADIDGALLTDMVFRMPTVRMVDAQGTFLRDKDGKVDRLLWHQGGRYTYCPRVP